MIYLARQNNIYFLYYFMYIIYLFRFNISFIEFMSNLSDPSKTIYILSINQS